MSLEIIRTLEAGQGRFELCHQAFKAIRKMHNPGSRVQDTARDVLQRLAGAERTEPAVQTVDNQEDPEIVQPEVAAEAPVELVRTTSD